MTTLFKLERLKYHRRNMFWIFAGMALFIFFTCSAQLLILGFEDNFNRDTFFDQFILTYCGSLTVPIAILVFYSIGLEFEHQIVHKSLVMGLSKWNYFFSKLLSSLGFTIFFVIFFSVLVLIYKFIFDYFVNISLEMYLLAMVSIANYVLMMFIFCLFFIFHFRTTKKVLIIFFTYIFSEQILNAVLNKVYDLYLWFLPFKAIRSIIVDDQRQINLLWSNPINFWLLLVLICYAILYLVFSYNRFLKKDLQ